MKGVMKGKMMKKLKSIKPIEYLKADKILQASHFDEFVESFPIKGNLKPFKFPTFKEQDSKRRAWSKTGVPKEPIQTVDVDELLREVEGEEKVERKEKEREIISKDESAEEEEEEEEEDKENIRPSISNQNAENSVSSEDKHRKQSTPFINSEPPKPVSEIGISSFRRPDMNSRTLFDPDLLAAFQEALIQHNRAQEEKKTQSEKAEQPEKAEERDDEEEEESFPLLNFEEKCPPGGIYSVILYTTSLRGIRKTFEDCHSVRFLLESFRVIFQERDISIHAEFREELWTTLGKKSVPPRLFIMGRYIGGAEEVLSLNEQGRLKPLFEGVPRKQRDCTCEGCGGFRFVVCMNCNGSTTVFDCEEEEEDGDGGGGLFSRRKCTECNENGLIFCPYCF